jgi:hypothetical protein
VAVTDSHPALGPAVRTDEDLLQAHAPVLRYDPQDLFRAISAESMVANPGNVLFDCDSETLACTPTATAVTGDALPELTLQFLAAYGDRRSPELERIAQAPGYALDARRMQAPVHPFARRVHGRVIRPDDRSAWLQYWLFYYYNPKNLRGLFKHEGDWEMIQVHVDAGGRPVEVTYAQHEFGEARRWDEIESDGERPVVYVGALSHASYFKSGSYPYSVLKHWLPFGIDHALGGKGDGVPEGPEDRDLTVDVLPEQGWTQWPGKWGSSERSILGKVGDGPASPGHQQPKWGDPAGYHTRQSRFGRTLRHLMHRAAKSFGKSTYPCPPAIHSAELMGGELTVRYSPVNQRQRRTKYVVLTVNQADGAQLVLASRTIKVKQNPDDTAHFRVPAGHGPLRVWASAYNGPRQRSDLACRDV